MDTMLLRNRLLRNGALRQGAFGATMAVLAAGIGAPPAAAHPALAALAGSWAGSGTVSVSNGTNERIRCRATYDVRERATSVAINLRCASDSYNFELHSTVQDDGGTVSGSWTESSRNVSGNISGRATGNQILVRADGPSFAANLLVHTAGNRQTVSIRASGGDITGVDVALTRK